MTADGRLDPHVRSVAIVVIVGAIMSILDTTIVNVALDTLSHDLHAPLSTLQWVSTGYLLALASVIPLTGWAAERFGPKRVWRGRPGGRPPAPAAGRPHRGRRGRRLRPRVLVVAGAGGRRIVPASVLALEQRRMRARGRAEAPAESVAAAAG